jgi:hypothetical protein
MWMVTASDGAGQEMGQEIGDRTGEGFVLLVDSAAIDPASWMRVALHAPCANRAYSLRGPAGARFGQAGAPVVLPPRRRIPADRIVRMPHASMRVTRVPQTFASFPQPRRRRRRISVLPDITERRGRIAAWTLLVAWLFGTWGTFFGVSGGLDFVPRGKTMMNHADNH